MNASPSQRPKILVVDDTQANLIAMRHMLARVDAEIVTVDSGNAALAACLNQNFAVILLDVQMPDMDGFEVAELLALEESTKNTPVIFVTAAYSDDINRLKGYSSGAVDYIAKPVNDLILLSKVRVFLELRRLLDQLDERNRQLQTEIRTRQHAEELARHQATHDPLTGLPNRMLFLDRVDTAIDRSRRSGKPFALGYVDIDGFKPVNDTHGHYIGDLLLQAIAKRMLDGLRREDTVARLGGDEFAFIMESAVDGPEIALHHSEKTCVVLRAPYALRDDKHDCIIEVNVGASLGLALFPLHGADREDLLRAADSAMYQAKRSGKNRCVLAAAKKS